MFSIVICTFNGEKKLKKVLDSILSQDGINDLVEEIIVVDNASTDKTAQIVQEYILKHSIITYAYESDSGLSNARKCGVNLASGEWIVFIDDDNYLEENWIIGAEHYIKNTKNVGVFNGNVIPYFENKLSDDQIDILKASYVGLACTTWSRNFATVNEKKWLPIGAGMVVLREPLARLVSLGWLKTEGRKGNEIISGEDTEISTWIKKQGYDYGFCKSIYLLHDIGERRLEIDYLKKLYSSFAIASYRLDILNRHTFLRLVKHSMEQTAIILFSLIKQEKIKGVEYYKRILATTRARTYLREVFSFCNYKHKRIK